MKQPQEETDVSVSMKKVPVPGKECVGPPCEWGVVRKQSGSCAFELKYDTMKTVRTRFYDVSLLCRVFVARRLVSGCGKPGLLSCFAVRASHALTSLAAEPRLSSCGSQA